MQTMRVHGAPAPLGAPLKLQGVTLAFALHRAGSTQLDSPFFFFFSFFTIFFLVLLLWFLVMQGDW